MGFFLLTGTGSASAFGRAPAPTPAPQPQVYSVSMTGYNAVPEQTDSEPFMTASGAYADPDIVAARSVDLADKLPYGTVIEVDSASSTSSDCGLSAVSPLVGLRVIADSMNSRKRDQIDILFHIDSSVVALGRRTNAATALGVCSDVSIRVVGHIDIAKMPQSQSELAEMIGQTPLASAN